METEGEAIDYRIPLGAMERLTSSDVELFVPESSGVSDRMLGRLAFSVEKPASGFVEEMAASEGWGTNPDALLLVARLGSKPIGFCSFQVHAYRGCETDPLACLSISLDLVFVRPRYRGRGVGNGLAAALIMALEGSFDANPEFSRRPFSVTLWADIYSEGGERFCDHISGHLEYALERANDPDMQDASIPMVQRVDIEAGW